MRLFGEEDARGRCADAFTVTGNCRLRLRSCILAAARSGPIFGRRTDRAGAHIDEEAAT